MFFLANFVAHAATVKSSPGQTALRSLSDLIYALLFPVSGIQRGLKAIFQHAILAETPLERAHRAGALCMVIRGPDWKPVSGREIKSEDFVYSEAYQNAMLGPKAPYLQKAKVVETDVWR